MQLAGAARKEESPAAKNKLVPRLDAVYVIADDNGVEPVGGSGGLARSPPEGRTGPQGDPAPAEPTAPPDRCRRTPRGAERSDTMELSASDERDYIFELAASVVDAGPRERVKCKAPNRLSDTRSSSGAMELSVSTGPGGCLLDTSSTQEPSSSGAANPGQNNGESGADGPAEQRSGRGPAWVSVSDDAREGSSAATEQQSSHHQKVKRSSSRCGQPGVTFRPLPAEQPSPCEPPADGTQPSEDGESGSLRRVLSLILSSSPQPGDLRALEQVHEALRHMEDSSQADAAVAPPSEPRNRKVSLLVLSSSSPRGLQGLNLIRQALREQAGDDAAESADMRQLGETDESVEGGDVHKLRKALSLLVQSAPTDTIGLDTVRGCLRTDEVAASPDAGGGEGSPVGLGGRKSSLPEVPGLVRGRTALSLVYLAANESLPALEAAYSAAAYDDITPVSSSTDLSNPFPAAVPAAEQELEDGPRQRRALSHLLLAAAPGALPCLQTVHDAAGVSGQPAEDPQHPGTTEPSFDAAVEAAEGGEPNLHWRPLSFLLGDSPDENSQGLDVMRRALNERAAQNDSGGKLSRDAEGNAAEGDTRPQRAMSTLVITCLQTNLSGLKAVCQALREHSAGHPGKVPKHRALSYLSLSSSRKFHGLETLRRSLSIESDRKRVSFAEALSAPDLQASDSDSPRSEIRIIAVGADTSASTHDGDRSIAVKQRGVTEMDAALVVSAGISPRTAKRRRSTPLGFTPFGISGEPRSDSFEDFERAREFTTLHRTQPGYFMQLALSIADEPLPGLRMILDSGVQPPAGRLTAASVVKSFCKIVAAKAVAKRLAIARRKPAFPRRQQGPRVTPEPQPPEATEVPPEMAELPPEMDELQLEMAEVPPETRTTEVPPETAEVPTTEVLPEIAEVPPERTDVHPEAASTPPAREASPAALSNDGGVLACVFDVLQARAQVARKVVKLRETVCEKKMGPAKSGGKRSVAGAAVGVRSSEILVSQSAVMSVAPGESQPPQPLSPMPHSSPLPPRKRLPRVNSLPKALHLRGSSAGSAPAAAAARRPHTAQPSASHADCGESQGPPFGTTECTISEGQPLFTQRAGPGLAAFPGRKGDQAGSGVAHADTDGPGIAHTCEADVEDRQLVRHSTLSPLLPSPAEAENRGVHKAAAYGATTAIEAAETGSMDAEEGNESVVVVCRITRCASSRAGSDGDMPPIDVRIPRHHQKTPPRTSTQTPVCTVRALRGVSEDSNAADCLVRVAPRKLKTTTIGPPARADSWSVLKKRFSLGADADGEGVSFRLLEAEWKVRAALLERESRLRQRMCVRCCVGGHKKKSAAPHYTASDASAALSFTALLAGEVAGRSELAERQSAAFRRVGTRFDLVLAAARNTPTKRAVFSA
eukprot:gene10134-15581_t